MATALLSFEEKLPDERLARSIWFMGGLFTVHADSKDTGGRFALIEIAGGPGTEPPLHIHENEDELFYVLEGSLGVTRGAEELVARAGDAVFLPRHVAHTFKILTPSVRWLNYMTPGGFEDYFRALGKPAKRLAPEVNPAPPDGKRMAELGFNFGLSFLV